MKRAVRRYQRGTVAVVSHDAVNRLLLGAFRPELGDPDAIPQHNGSFNVLMWQGDGFSQSRDMLTVRLFG
jgi:broad specificity phosphatase PhoE